MEQQEELIRQYSNLQLQYVEFQKYMVNKIENLLIENNIKYQNLTGRVKTLKSLEQKLNKKKILEEIDGNIQKMYDLCGVRVVLYDSQQLNNLINTIINSFDIVNFTNKKFEYNSNNIAVKLRNGLYKNFICEIQVVTLMSHNLIEIGHDIIYKDQEKLKEKDKEEYENLKNEYKKCLEEVYKLESRIDSLKKKKQNILNNYEIFNKIISNNFLRKLEDNKSLDTFYDACKDVLSIVSFLSRNKKKADVFYKKKIIEILVEDFEKVEKENYILTKEFVFDKLMEVLYAFSSLWSNSTSKVLNVMVKYLECEKNERMNRSFFSTISRIAIEDIKNNNWVLFSKVKDWILKNKTSDLYRAKMVNAIVKDSIEYIEQTGYREYQLQRKELKYTDKGKKVILELHKFVFELFMQNQTDNLYNEFINITYNFDFLVEAALELFDCNYNLIEDIYRYDLLQKVYHSFEEITKKSSYYEKIKSDKFFEIWKCFNYECFNKGYKRTEYEKNKENSKRKIKAYVQKINNISQSEIIRIIKNYNKLIKEGRIPVMSLKEFLYEVGIKYDKAEQIYKKYKNAYIYLGLRKKGVELENEYKLEVLKAMELFFNTKVFNEYLSTKKKSAEKDIMCCNIIVNKELYKYKKYHTRLFGIIKRYNINNKPLLYKGTFMKNEFFANMTIQECSIILDNYFVCILNKKEINDLGFKLMYMFMYFPERVREFIDRIVKEEKIKDFNPERIYITDAENYQTERINNAKLVIEWLKKYEYWKIYRYIESLIKYRDEDLVNDLKKIVMQDKNSQTSYAIARIIKEVELGAKIWPVAREIIIQGADEKTKRELYIAMIEVGCVSSFYTANKNRREEINKILKQEKNDECKKFLEMIHYNLNQTIKADEYNEAKQKYEEEIEAEKYCENN